MQKLINELLEGFSNDNPRNVYCFDESVNPEFYDLIRELHDGMLPNNFIFDTVHSALSILRDCEIESEDDYYDAQNEMSDSMTPIYTSELNDHYRDFSEFAEIAKEDLCGNDASISQCITGGCYLHCSNILNDVFNFVNEVE